LKIFVDSNYKRCHNRETFFYELRRKDMKQMFLCLIAGILAQSPAFAGGGSQGGRGSAKEVVVFLERGNIRDEFIPALMRDFEVSSGYKVNVINGGDDSLYRQNLSVALNGGQEIDVLICNGQAVRSFANRGVIEDITKLVTYWNRFGSNSIQQFTYSGKTYGVPYGHITSSGVFYNTGILKKYNLSPPRTYDDLVRMRDVLARDNISVFGFGGGSKYMWPMWFFCAFAQTSGNKSMERTEATLRGQAKWTDKDYVDAMAILERMGKDGLFQPGVNGMETAQGLAVFSSGKSALFYGGTWELTGFRDSGMTDDKLGIVPFPIVVPGTRPEQTGSAGSPALCLRKGLNAEKQKAALELMAYFSSDAKVQQHYDLLGSSLPNANKGYRLPQNADPLVTSAIIPDLVPATVTFLDWAWPPEITTAFQDQIQAVTGGQTTAAAAMAEIQKVFDNLVKGGYNFDATN
jgi:raffinose/stachyose/melibiose transport system substrate-binding protein